MSKYFYHGIYDEQNMLEITYRILKSQKIKTKKQLHFEEDFGFNGLHHISVCKKEDSRYYDSEHPHGFYSYVQNHFCFILREDLPVIKPTYISDLGPEEYARLREESGEEVRYTDMVDEWQVLGGIPFAYVIGLGIPVTWLEEHAFSFFPYISLLQLKKILRLANALGLDIVDSSQEDFVEKYEAKRKIHPKLKLVGKKLISYEEAIAIDSKL